MSMKKLYANNSLGRFLGIVLAIIILSGCSQKAVNEDAASSIALSMKVTEPALIELVSQFLLIVTGPDMERIETTLTLQGQYIVGEVEVPAGRDRRFVVSALDEAGRLIYQGDTTVDIEAGTEIVLNISLYPQVPLVKLSPRFQPVQSNATFSLDVRVSKIHNLYGISFRILFESYLVRPESIQVNPDLIRVDHIDIDSGFYAIGLSETDTTRLLVDTSGNATLATVYFQSLYPEIGADTTTLTIKVTELRRPDGSFIPIGSVYTDEALVEVSQGSNPVVTFPDTALDFAIRDLLSKYEGDLFLSDVDTITELFAWGTEISDLTGLSNLTSLRLLNLETNQISIIDELASLVKLRQLFLRQNLIQDITALTGLDQLSQVGLDSNLITDISPLVANNAMDSTSIVWLMDNPILDTTQVELLCYKQVTVYLITQGSNWCLGIGAGQSP